MIVFPFFKFLETLIDGLYLGACPWIDETGLSNSDRYLDMGRITIITITYTIFMAIIYLICKGWNTRLFYMTRN